MGWGRYFLLGDLGQQMDIEDQNRDLERIRREMRNRRMSDALKSQDHFKRLQEENDELKLYVAALIRLMLVKKLATPEEIGAMVDAIDREDGVADGKFSGPLADRSP